MKNQTDYDEKYYGNKSALTILDVLWFLYIFLASVTGTLVFIGAAYYLLKDLF